jgi:hypothetical protein
VKLKKPDERSSDFYFMCGRLAPGWAADQAVLEQDPRTAPLDELIGLTTRLTMVGGDVMHHVRAPERSGR